MKKGNNRPFVAAVLVAACWASVSAITSAHVYAQEGGADSVVLGPSFGPVDVKYTLFGDANLDGLVSGDDFTILTGLDKSSSTWNEGDFSFNGLVAGDGFTLLVQHLGISPNLSTGGIPAADLAAIDAFAAANGLQADVPEPASLGLLAIGTLGVLSRRRDHRA
jgi:hypothetical protein